jgi:hypothetical protein
VIVGIGAGSPPFFVNTGKAYLAGPYKGAPLSLLVVAPAVAGPIDLGTVATRTALHVDPETAQVTAVSDPLPSALQGIALDLRDIRVIVDRSEFMLNPTSCRQMAFAGQAFGEAGAVSPLREDFQVGGCRGLGFKPKLSLRLRGRTTRGGFPRLTAILSPRRGDANIGKATVVLPHSEFIAQEHFRTICTRVQFAADKCPSGSVYGHAKVFTPTLNAPLEGPVYLRSSTRELPDLVIALKGQLDVVAVGHIDSVKGRLRTAFETVPDVPVSKFVLQMKGGQKGLFVNSHNLCKAPVHAQANFVGHNGKSVNERPLLRADCKPSARKNP